MKAIILAGGMGSRLSEETVIRPKPLVEIGGMPILWHIMKIYSTFGINDFVICLGYKGYLIKEYFENYQLRMSDVTFDIKNGKTDYHRDDLEPWKITLVDTGKDFGTGGRLKRVLPLVEGEKSFHFTYGDGVGPIDIRGLENFHHSHDCKATVTATRPPKRFGLMDLNGDVVASFEEKAASEGGWVNGGFFVLSPEVGNLIENDTTYWEMEPMKKLVEEKQLRAFRHHGYWQPMDTLRDRETLEHDWSLGLAPWKIWGE